jgi:hypothetical protein
VPSQRTAGHVACLPVMDGARRCRVTVETVLDVTVVSDATGKAAACGYVRIPGALVAEGETVVDAQRP